MSESKKADDNNYHSSKDEGNFERTLKRVAKGWRVVVVGKGKSA